MGEHRPPRQTPEFLDSLLIRTINPAKDQNTRMMTKFRILHVLRFSIVPLLFAIACVGLCCFVVPSLTKVPSVSCSEVSLIVQHPEIVKTLRLDVQPYPRARLRVFSLRTDIEACSGEVGNWLYHTYSEVRPSLNTGYHRDLILYRDTSNNSILTAYVSSYENYEDRQTNYIFKFQNTTRDQDEIKLLSIGEYAD